MTTSSELTGDVRTDLAACLREAEHEQAVETERAETARLYWEHREQGHNVDVVSGCPICDELVDECERIAAGGKCP